jgi:hypothetical protein
MRSEAALRSYFDGSAKDDSSQYNVVSLGFVCGIPSQWIPLEHSWQELLIRHDAPFLHTADALTRNDVYRGWTCKQVSAFLSDAVKTIGKHLARKNRPTQKGTFGLYPGVISVVLRDFIAAFKARSDLANNANEICLRQALEECFMWGHRIADCDSFKMFFDRGEPFYGYALSILNSKRANRMNPLLSKVSIQPPSNMRNVPGLQLADLFAWGVNHRNDPNPPEWHSELLRMDRHDLWIDHTNVLNVNHSSQMEWRSWKVPQRRPTT